MIASLRAMMVACIKGNGETFLLTYPYYRLASNSNIKDGVGVMFWPDGTKYEGDFLND